MTCKLKKKIHEAPIPHFLSHISKIVWRLPMFDFCIFCHLPRLMRIYRVGPPSGYLKSFFPSFQFFLSFFFFFSFLGVFFFCIFLGGPFSSGAPGHCPPMPPSCYATVAMITFAAWCQRISTSLTLVLSFQVSWEKLTASLCWLEH